MADIGIRVPLLLIRTPLLLQQIKGLATWFTRWINFKDDYKLLFFYN